MYEQFANAKQEIPAGALQNRQTEIGCEMDNMGGNINRLEQAFQELDQRINSVVRNVPTEKQQDKEIKTKPLTALAQGLAEYNSRIIRLTYLVDDLRSRVEL